MNTKTINIILQIIVVIGITIAFICSYITTRKQFDKIKKLTEEIEYYKQAAHPSIEIIDSLQYNIEYRDSIIYNIKHEYIKDVEIIKNMVDYDVVNLFNKLVWTD